MKLSKRPEAQKLAAKMEPALDKLYKDAIKEVFKTKEASAAVAFNLLLGLSEHGYGYLGGSIKVSDWGDVDEPIQNMDDLLLDFVSKRAISPPYSNLWGVKRDLRLLLGRKLPNKQQRGQSNRIWRADLR
ncbi:hypothetical protein F4776DRAFT_606712 [Hypoxylon sp. NC0597]|nr:hypothetical protein F4776DRAFT_606712 [Hypoxylon sp. NC0597]